MEGSSPIKETTLSIQVSVGFNNLLCLLNTNQGNSLNKLQLKGKKGQFIIPPHRKLITGLV